MAIYTLRTREAECFPIPLTVGTHGQTLSVSIITMTEKLIRSFWPDSFVNPKLSPVSALIEQVLKHTKTTFSISMLAMVYLVRLYTALDAIRTRERCSSGVSGNGTPCLYVPQKLNEKGLSYTICGRRMYITALMIAHKYHQEPAMKNVAWSNLTRLDLNEVNEMERQFLKLIQYNLHVSVTEYQLFVDRFLTDLPVPASKN
jgi:hypothetical protein